MHRHRFVLLAIVLVAAPLAAPGCSTNALTGKRNFMLISPSEDITLGQQAAPGVSGELGGPYGDPVMKQYVQAVGRKVAAEALKSGSYEYPFTFDVLDTDVVNAFALPGGPIFVTRALLFQMQDESELAGVLAHEVTHVAARHSAQAISKQVGAEIVLSVLKTAAGEKASGTAGTAADLAKVVGGLISLKYTRDNETESDTFGTQFAVQAGYTPAGLIRVMEMFMQQEAASGGSGGPAFLRTHPYPDDRIVNIRNVIAKKYPSALTDPRLAAGREAYQQNVLSRKSLLKQYSKAK